MGKQEYWNDDTQSLTYKGKDYASGDVVPEFYAKEQPKKYAAFKKNLQISEKKQIKFEEKKNRELLASRSAVDKLQVRTNALLAEKGELEKKVLDFEIRIDELEELDSIKKDLDQLKVEKKYLSEMVKEMEKTWTAPKSKDAKP